MTRALLLLASISLSVAPGALADPAAVADLIINEVLYDPHPAQPPSVPNGDANLDGARDGSGDEFIEIVNTSALPVDLSGYKINDAVTTRHVFPEGTTVESGCVILVFGGGAPAGPFGGAVVQTASTGFLGLNNGGDTITLLDAGDVVIDTFSYEGSISDQSMTRNPDITGAFSAHTIATGDPDNVHSPGTQISGDSFGGCDAVQVETSTWGKVKSVYR